MAELRSIWLRHHIRLDRLSLPPRDTTRYCECCWCELPCWLFNPQPVLILPSPCSFPVHLLCRLLTCFQHCCFLNQALLAPQQYFCLSMNSGKCWHFPLATPCWLGCPCLCPQVCDLWNLRKRVPNLLYLPLPQSSTSRQLTSWHLRVRAPLYLN